MRDTTSLCRVLPLPLVEASNKKAGTAPGMAGLAMSVRIAAIAVYRCSSDL
ncbi:hypothetical protein WME89_40935 [Sorangium sp. So ce321]|uniref:hypothetical protein n=1 Tax=Sorangium sp. So ce321 TaxID=3133300 RepID=UPI003F5E9FC1